MAYNVCVGKFSVRWQPVFAVFKADGMAVNFPTQKVMSLAAYLLIQRGKPSLRSHLAEELWPRSDSQKARLSLRNAVFHLRSAFGQDTVISDYSTVCLNPERFEMDAIDEGNDRFAEQILDDWAVRVRSSALRAQEVGSPVLPPPPVDAFLATLDYMIESDPESALTLAATAHSLSHQVPVDQLITRLESIVLRAPQVERETLLVKILLATKYQGVGRYSEAIDCLRSVAKVAEERRFDEIMEAAAYNLFVSWLLADRPTQARRYADWLAERGPTALSLMAQAQWSFQFADGGQASSRLREAAFAARLEGEVPCEQRALASLIAVDAQHASPAVVSRLEELGTLPSLGIGRFAAGFSRAVLGELSGRLDDSKAEFERTIADLQSYKENRLVLGSLHYACVMLNHVGQYELAVETLGACEVWRHRNMGPFLPAEARNLKRVRASTISQLGRAEFERCLERGRRLSRESRFHLR